MTPSAPGPSWFRRRGWPRAGQIILAVVIGLIAATLIGALTRHDGSKTADTSSTSTAASTPTTLTTTTTRATRTTVAPTTTIATATTVARTTTVKPRKAAKPPTAARPVAPRLVPLSIAAASHQAEYSRAADFGGWIDVAGCQDTRATLLMRTSLAPVTFTSPKDCTVKTGRWVDPWSGAVTNTAHDFQIDHTVPLANAWRSGAWSWTEGRRIAYANDLADQDHLVPILASENESKSDGGPDAWKPPNPSAWCRYATAWDHIKAKWHLTATPSEWTALNQMAATC